MLLNYQQKQTSLNEVDQNFENIFVLHGLFGSLSNLAGVAASLQGSHRVISVDLRNHGESPHQPNNSYPEMASDIFALADHLKIEKFSILGHSMGGKVAMYCALLQPERINKLVIADIAPVSYSNRHQDVFTALQTLTAHPIASRQAADKLLSSDIETAATRQFILKSLYKKDGVLQLRFNFTALRENYDLIRGWPQIDSVFNKPVLFIKGGDSDYIQETYSADIGRYFPAAKAKIITNAGHWLHADKASIFNRLVNNFFNYTDPERLN